MIKIIKHITEVCEELISQITVTSKILDMLLEKIDNKDNLNKDGSWK